MSNDALLTIHNLPRPIEAGDSGLILTADGGFFVFNTGKIDPENLTETQIMHADILRGFVIALKVPQLMDILIQAANDPAIAGSKMLDTAGAH